MEVGEPEVLAWKSPITKGVLASSSASRMESSMLVKTRSVLFMDPIKETSKDKTPGQTHGHEDETDLNILTKSELSSVQRIDDELN